MQLDGPDRERFAGGGTVRTADPEGACTADVEQQRSEVR
jgi:hypothetical protein